MRDCRHFLTLRDVSGDELRALIQRAMVLKRDPYSLSLTRKVLAMLFEKPSTRTRVSFETAMAQLGGHAIFLNKADSQLGRGESIEDTARVLSQMVDAVMIRNDSHADLELFAKHATVPTINGLTDRHHPCQLLADMLSYFERRGDIQGHSVAWIGDASNVCNSYIDAAVLLGFELTIASPAGYEIDAVQLGEAKHTVRLVSDPLVAVKEADLVVTDVWTSMGQEAEEKKRLEVFKSYQVNAALMAHTNPRTLFMHCLPAHRGEEVSDAVIDGKQSIVWEEAGNRLHAQKALLELLLR